MIVHLKPHTPLFISISKSISFIQIDSASNSDFHESLVNETLTDGESTELDKTTDFVEVDHLELDHNTALPITTENEDDDARIDELPPGDSKSKNGQSLKRSKCFPLIRLYYPRGY